MDVTATIIAIASPPGRSPRGIIRLSGSAVPDVLRAVCMPPSPLGVEDPPQAGGAGGEGFSDFPARGIYTTHIKLNQFTIPTVALNYIAPHSYTGEHAVEFLLPGNTDLLQRLTAHIIDLSRSQKIDIRLAQPGEFTARAFFTGNISLTQAEGVAATISARCDAELRAAALLRNDSIGTLAASQCADLTTALALLEAGIDFTDEQDVIAITTDDLRAALTKIRSTLHAQLERSVGGGQYDAAPRIVITGKPNAGKSTLFNALLGHSRAVVSKTAGTTRDVLMEPLRLSTPHGELEVLLMDIAGIEDETSSLLTQHMQHVATEARTRADLLLHCIPFDHQTPARPAPNELIIRTKCDTAHEKVNEIIHSNETLPISATTGTGLDKLRQRIAERLADRAVAPGADAVALLPRHEHAMRETVHGLDDALHLLKRSTDRAVCDSELVAAAMRHSLDQLGLIAGRVTPDDVLGKIFSEFCIGK